MGKRFSILLLSGASFFLAGCGGSEPPEPLPVEDVPRVMQETFTEAPPEVTQQANTVVEAVERRDPDAVIKLQTLSARPDLNEEQRREAARAMAALLGQLNQAAEKGDQQAAATLKKYQSSK